MLNNSLVKNSKNNLISLIEKSKAQFDIALPKHMQSERFVRIALTEIRKNPKLMECDPKSLLGALMTSAQLGLEPGVLGQSYLIPFKNKRLGITECQFQISYKGMIELLRRTGQLKDLYAYEVCENDVLKVVYGLDRGLIHEPNMDDRGEVIGYYSVAILKDETKTFEYMTKKEVEKHAKEFSMAYSRGYDSPWKSSFDSMAKKTVVKKMLKWLPVSVEQLEKDDSKSLYNPVTKRVEQEAEPFMDDIEQYDQVTGEIENTSTENDDFGGF